jgi:hypothetical protein
MLPLKALALCYVKPIMQVVNMLSPMHPLHSQWLNVRTVRIVWNSLLLFGLFALSAFTFFVREFVLETEHAALTYLKTLKPLSGQVARWLVELQEYTFTPRYRK